MFARQTPRLFLFFLLVPAVLVGCGIDTVTAPEQAATGFVVTPEVALVDVDMSPWYIVAQEKVNPGNRETVVQGSRYTLTFSKGAVQRATTITVMEVDPDVIRVQFFPDEQTFSAPVVLTVDYAGTANDPRSPMYHGRELKFARYDRVEDSWTILEGVNDPESYTYTVTLTGFSEYALGDPMWNPRHIRRGQGENLAEAGN